MSVVSMSTSGDTSTELAVYLNWESKGEHGNDLDEAARSIEFQEWISRMMVKHLKWEKVKADAWLQKVIVPNKLTSVHEFVSACKLPLSIFTSIDWTTS